MCRAKSKAARHLILHFLYRRREKLDHPAAIRTDHVIVVLVIVVVLVIGLVVAESDLASQPGLGQKLQRSVNRCQADARVFFMNKIMQVFAG